jgi:hypothetical protein
MLGDTERSLAFDPTTEAKRTINPGSAVPSAARLTIKPTMARPSPTALRNKP